MVGLLRARVGDAGRRRAVPGLAWLFCQGGILRYAVCHAIAGLGLFAAFLWADVVLTKERYKKELEQYKEGKSCV